MYGCENDLSPQQVMRVGINLNDVAERFTGRRTGCNNGVHNPQIVCLLHAMPRWNDKPKAQPTTASLRYRRCVNKKRLVCSVYEQTKRLDCVRAG